MIDQLSKQYEGLSHLHPDIDLILHNVQARFSSLVHSWNLDPAMLEILDVMGYESVLVHDTDSNNIIKLFFDAQRYTRAKNVFEAMRPAQQLLTRHLLPTVYSDDHLAFAMPHTDGKPPIGRAQDSDFEVLKAFQELIHVPYHLAFQKLPDVWDKRCRAAIQRSERFTSDDKAWVTRAKEYGNYCLTQSRAERTQLLHGDLHIYNALRSPDHISLIDHQGIWGDQAYDRAVWLVKTFPFTGNLERSPLYDDALVSEWVKPLLVIHAVAMQTHDPASYQARMLWEKVKTVWQ